MRELLGLLAAFLLIAFVINWWQVILAVLLIVGIGYTAYAAFGGWWQLRREAKAVEAERVKRLIADANAQHHSYMEGFEHGLYGNYKPVDLDRL